MATQMYRTKPSSRGWGTVDLSTAANGQSTPFNIGGCTLCAVQMSAAWDTANIGFRGSVDGTTTNLADLHATDGTFLTYATSAAYMTVFDPAFFAGMQLLQIVSETSAGVAVAQTAARVLKVSFAEYAEAD